MDDEHELRNRSSRSTSSSIGIPSSEESKEICIKIITLSRHFNIIIDKNSTVFQLKEKIKESGSIPREKNIRLIFSGKILENESILSFLKISDGSTIHCSVSESVVINNLNSSSEPTNEPRGFNRLRNFGFDQSEIDHVRTQFHTHRLVNNGFLPTNMNADHLLTLEEEWINSEGLANSNNNNNNNSREDNNNREPQEEESEIGNNEDMFKGLMMGFSMGLIVLLFITEGSITFRMKVGIVAGLSASFLFGVMRLMMG